MGEGDQTKKKHFLLLNISGNDGCSLLKGTIFTRRLEMDFKTINSASISLLVYKNKSTQKTTKKKKTQGWLSLHTIALCASLGKDQALPA